MLRHPKELNMKAIINGRRWDTEKASLVCKIFEGNRNDFRHIDAGLYCTPRSRSFFLAGWGGAMTIFARSCGDNTKAGSNRIIPLSTEEALEWAERHASVEIIEKYFDVVDVE